MKSSGRISSLALRTRMLLLFGGGTAVILLLVKIISLFGVPFLDVKGEYELQTNKAVADIQIIADLQKKLLELWFNERLSDLQLFSSSELTRLGIMRAVHFVDNGSNSSEVLYDELTQDIQLKQLTHQMELLRGANGQYESIDLVEVTSGLSVASTIPERVGSTYPYGNLLHKEGVIWDRRIAFMKTEERKQPSIFFVSPIQPGDDHKLKGFAVFEAPAELFLQKVLSAEKSLGVAGEIILIDMQKTLLTPLRFKLPDGSDAQPLQYSLKTRSAEFAAWGVDGLVEALDYRGVQVVSVVRHLRLTPGFAVSMIVSMDRGELYAPVQKSLKISLIVLGLGIGMIILLVVVVARQLAWPIEQLNRTSIRIGAGDLGARAPEVGSFEMQALSHTFNAMANRIQQSHENLEAQVEKRTIELEKKNRLLQLEVEERQEVEERIRLSEERFRLAMDATNDGLWDWNLETGEMYYSPQYYRMLGYDSDEFENRIDTWLNLLHPEDKKAALEENSACINNKTQSFNIEFRLKARDGSWRFILCRGRAVARAEDGRATKMIGTHVDITERKQLENQLMQSQKMESIGRLAGGIAHDFNNMLAVIFLSLELARTKIATKDPLHEHLNDIEKAAARSRDITRHLLAFSRKQVILPQRCQLNDIYRALENSIVRLIGEDIELKFHPDDELGYIMIDPSQIDQVLVNLAVNARDAMPNGGRLTVETANVSFDQAYCEEHNDLLPGDYVNLTVSDEGVGIPKESLDTIFEPFFTTKEVGKGTGLGLAMIYGVVKQHQGYINVESEVNRGTSFKLYFPRLAEDNLNAEAEVHEAEEVAGGQGGILLVEDDVVLCEMTKAMLEQFGYTVTIAHSPKEALLLFEEDCPDFSVMLTDVVMPGMNGRQLAEKVTGQCPDIRVIFMSGYTTDAVVYRGVIEENVDFIQKPFSIKELAGKIREVIERQSDSLR